ncbi:MAG: response regulator [Magnetococcales bacterium]|nr:response regulator [Magnetococcales bacterium]
MTERSKLFPATRLWWVLLVGLLALGVGWINWSMNQSSDDADIVDALGRQRMLSQAMGKAILAHAMARGSFQFLEQRIRTLDAFVDDVRRVYTAHVAPPALDAGLIDTGNWKVSTDTIPVPAAFVRLVNETFGARTGLSLDILSPHPVNPDKGIVTPHDQAAYDFLKENKHGIHHHSMNKGGRLVLHFYTSDTATDKSCVSCHDDNTQRKHSLDEVLGIRKFEVIFSEDVALGEQELNPSMADFETARNIFKSTMLAMQYGGRYPEDLAQTQLRTVRGIHDEKAQDKLIEIAAKFAQVNRSVALLLESEVNSMPYRLARQDITKKTQQLMVLNDQLVKIFTAIASRHRFWTLMSVSITGLGVVLLLLWGAWLFSTHLQSERRLKAQREELTRLVEARTKDLSAAKQAAERANRAKSAFLAHMSHEIRTPLNAILGMGELLKEGALNDAQQWCVQTLNRSGESLLALINDILDLSKIEAGKLTLESTTFDLRQLVDDAVDPFVFTALEKKIELNRHVDEEVPQWVRGDAVRLQQVLINLLGNALKFTRQGQVSMTVTQRDDGQISMAVSDTGPGVSTVQREEIFRPFTQADPSITRDHGGTGLGLTISRRLADVMGGTIGLESQFGKGSTFTVTLPLPEVHAPQKVVHSSRQQDVQVQTGIADHTPSEKPQKGSDHVSPKRILVVDDSEDNRRLVEAFLKREPYQLVMAVNGAEAVAAFIEQRFDLVLMDIQMPVMDGYDATRRIRKWESKRGMPSTPILALTAHAIDEESEQIMAVGCDLHLTKPIRKQRLLNSLRRYIEQGAHSDGGL